MTLRRIHSLLLLSLLAFTLGVYAQETAGVSGRWQGNFDIPAPDGTFQHDTAFFVLKEDGSQVSGSAGRNEELQTPISQGGFHGGLLTFSVEVRSGTVVKFDLRLGDGHLKGIATGVPPDPNAKIAVDIIRAPDLTVESLLRPFMGSILIVRDGHALADHSFGSANLEWHVPNTSATRFRIGSLTKQFTAASILLLQERGKLRIDDPISKYLEDTPPAWSGITIFHLLTHTSGIISITDLSPGESMLWRGGSPSEIMKRFRDQPLLFPSGTQARYSNSGYILLGMIIEKASGEPYDAFLRKNIFEPLGMRDTGIDNNADVLENRASGYRTEGAEFRHAEYIDMSVPFAAGDLYSTTHDLQRWEEGLFGGKVLRPDSLSRMLTPNKGDFGFGLVVTQDDGQRLISHTGGIKGFTAELRYYPEKRLSVIVLSNTESKATLELSRLLSQQALNGSIALGSPDDTLRDEVLAADHRLFEAYNTCDINTFSRSLAPDLEFFHDTTGLTDHDWNVKALEKRCSETTKYRRSLDQQSVQVFPVPGYGAMEFGLHRFYEHTGNGSEKLDAAPQFANVWRKTNEGWKLAVVLSYGHR
jgi:CubicO group peptidase (beta-lactamase class C family)